MYVHAEGTRTNRLSRRKCPCIDDAELADVLRKGKQVHRIGAREFDGATGALLALLDGWNTGYLVGHLSHVPDVDETVLGCHSEHRGGIVPGTREACVI